MRRRYGYCTPCGKRRYATEQAAEADLARMQSLPRTDQTPIRTYPCPEGWWHTTHLPPAKWTTAYAGNTEPPAADALA